VARRKTTGSASRLPLLGNPHEELIGAIQTRIDDWVGDNYPDASDLTRALLSHWFGEPHLRSDGSFFQWYPHQRRAVETAIYLYEVWGARRVQDYAALADLERAPQRDPWAKLGFQMATGSGKTKVMSLLATWAHLHWVHDTELVFGNTQLLIAPNLIVLERLLADFRNGVIFERDPLVPPEYRRDWSLRVVTPDGIPTEWRPGEGYLVVTNIHKLYLPEGENDAEPLLPQLALFEVAPPTKLDEGAPPLLRFVRDVKTPLVVFNDEAHHVHDEETHTKRGRPLDADEEEGIAWHEVLTKLHSRAGLALQMDLSATLYEEISKRWFRHTVYDYPLHRAIADGVVKQPYLGKVRLQYKDGHDEPIPLVDDSALNAWDRYSQLIQAGIAEWKKEQRALDEYGLDRKAILFVVCGTSKEATEVAAKLAEFVDIETGEPLFAGKVVQIHIGRKEGMNEKAWQKVRDEVARVDAPDNPYTAVVSVMMLKEGWDVRNVKVIVPLRPCDSRQLTEQLLGRGLRLMFPPYWTADGELKDSGFHERLYVIRHPSFEAIIRDIRDIVAEETEEEAGDLRPSPSRMVISPVEPDSVRTARDLPIVQIVGAFETGDDWVATLNRAKMPPLSQRHPWVTNLREVEGIIKHEGVPGAQVGDDTLRYDVRSADYVSIDAAIASYAENIRAELRLSRYYEATIKGVIKAFLERCTFDLPGIPLSIDLAAEGDEQTARIVLANILRPKVKSDVIQHVARIIGLVRAGEENPEVQLETRWARELPTFEAVPRNVLHHPMKCVFDACCFDSLDEHHLATLLDDADDVASWLWNDQAGVQFRIQYAFEGRTPYYYPDFVVRLTDGAMVIVESKGSIRDRDRAKQARAERYVDLLTRSTRLPWSYLFLINDRAIGREDIAWWSRQGRTLFRDLVRHVENAPNPGMTVSL
jgi:type III restriction enzyme